MLHTIHFPISDGIDDHPNPLSGIDGGMLHALFQQYPQMNSFDVDTSYQMVYLKKDRLLKLSGTIVRYQRENKKSAAGLEYRWAHLSSQILGEGKQGKVSPVMGTLFWNEELKAYFYKSKLKKPRVAKLIPKNNLTINAGLVVESAANEQALLSRVPMYHAKKLIKISEDSHMIISRRFPGIEVIIMLNGNMQFQFEQYLLLFINIAKSLSTLHMHDIVHRDLNMHNCLINPKDMSAVIIDLGFAKLVNQTSSGGSIIGSLSHTPPETWEYLKVLRDIKTRESSRGSQNSDQLATLIKEVERFQSLEDPQTQPGDVWSFNRLLFKLTLGKRGLEYGLFDQNYKDPAERLRDKQAKQILSKQMLPQHILFSKPPFLLEDDLASASSSAVSFSSSEPTQVAKYGEAEQPSRVETENFEKMKARSAREALYNLYVEMNDINPQKRPNILVIVARLTRIYDQYVTAGAEQAERIRMGANLERTPISSAWFSMYNTMLKPATSDHRPFIAIQCLDEPAFVSSPELIRSFSAKH